jgi:hypothetical protein
VHWLVILALVLAFVGGWHWWTSEREVHRPPGIIAPEDPKQIDLNPPETFNARGYSFAKRARFDITARLVHKSRYRIDAEAGLAPIDFVVGWGPLSDSALLDQLEFSQMGRWFYWNPKNGQFPLSREMMVTHLAQMHMIPSTKEIASLLDRVRPGQLVTVSGYLVDVRGANGFTWKTSLSRSDTGDGSCEVVWVESLETD